MSSPPRTENPRSSDALTAEVARIAHTLSEQFNVIAGDAATVEVACTRLRELSRSSASSLRPEIVLELSSLLGKRTGQIAETLFAFLEEAAAKSDGAEPLLCSMLNAREESLVLRALKLAVRLSAEHALRNPDEIVSHIAIGVERGHSVLCSREALLETRTLLLNAGSAGSPESTDDRVLVLYLSSATLVLRRLAARILDLAGEPAPAEPARKILGSENAEFLASYLAYTRASHLDLLDISRHADVTPGLFADLRRAEEQCGEERLRRLISALGWSQMNVSLELHRFRQVDIEGSLPLFLTPEQWLLFRDCEQATPRAETLLVVAQGSSPSSETQSDNSSDAVERFRRMNLLHAELLEDILDMVPLSADVLARIVSRMDQVVEIYCDIFGKYDEESSILRDVYGDLKRRINEADLNGGSSGDASPELTRLVRMFEDPASLGSVRTLHGLKRYLHQRGLHLGFKLVDTTRLHGRTITLATLGPADEFVKATGIQYTDFDLSASADLTAKLPLAISLLIDSLKQQLLYGLQVLPAISVFCYGAEVHYYITFRNHPVFLRIDFSPPLRGGMIDLQYYGVSKYELSDHPDISLTALRSFLEKLEFDVSIEDTRIHARCDKERILDLGTLCVRARALLSLIPFLMDIDWTIGSLELPPEAKRKVAAAWSDSFPDWGTLPIRYLLTSDRRGILLPGTNAAGPGTESAWDGEGDYADRYLAEPPESLMVRFNNNLRALDLEQLTSVQGDGGRRTLGYARLERKVFLPLETATKRGEIAADQEGLRIAPIDRFRREHAVERFAAIIDTGDKEIIPAIRTAWLIAPLEKSLRFETTGCLEGCRVQSALLSLRDELISLHVLRDRSGNSRLAMFARDSILYRHRTKQAESWESNGLTDFMLLEKLLRANSYIAEGGKATPTDAESEARRFLSEFSCLRPARPASLLPGERIIRGLNASAGRRVGRVLLGIRSRTPADVKDCIIVLPSLGPQHNAYIYHCAGVVSTSGAALSHAGLIATQYAKPALIVQGKWKDPDSDSAALECPATIYDERAQRLFGFTAAIRHNIRSVIHTLCDNDLVVLDASEGKLHVLGQNKDTLELYESILQMRRLRHQLTGATSQQDVLAIRGRRLHARHQVEKILSQLTDPVAAKHVVLESVLSIPHNYRQDVHEDRELVLTRLVKNPRVGSLVTETLLQALDRLDNRYLELCQRAVKTFDAAALPAGIISLRLSIKRLSATLTSIRTLMTHCGISVAGGGPKQDETIDSLALKRITALRDTAAELIADVCKSNPDDPRLRHQHQLLGKLDRLLTTESPRRDEVQRCSERLEQRDEELLKRAAARRVLFSAECSSALTAVIGCKAANLAEIQRLVTESMVPAWFVVTDAAFREVMDSRHRMPAAVRDKLSVRENTLGGAIGEILQRTDLDAEQKSVFIGRLWDAVDLPEALHSEIVEAYDRLFADPGEIESADGDSNMKMVAVRSSACEEDRDIDMRAGEFESFLFISGVDAVIQYLKRAWSGLWTTRAIQSRELFNETSERVAGGVIIQRAVLSRLSGVLLTVNLADNNMEEMVINVGLGLGEGVVSGKVAADHVVVDKQRFLNAEPRSYRYTTAEKTEQIAFDPLVGRGTRIKQSLYHQRMRPALEFLELQELVAAAANLESTFGHPLDIEFAFEGCRLRMLQVRPVPSCMADLRDTIECFPLTAKDEDSTPETGSST